MPSVFSRRRASTGHVVAAPSSSAAIAATSAFLKSSPSSASLSSAAAAAALRSHTTSPEPVGNTQTRRMARRDSQSSTGSAAFASNASQNPRQYLTRRGSSGSMTERTFRSPSPGGASPSRSRPAAVDAPPVPSLDPTHTTRSPPPSRPASAASLRSKTASAKGSRPHPLSKVQELEREGSQRSINFSRPMASPMDTPPHSPERPKTSASWFSGPVRTNVAPRNTVTDRPRSAAGNSRSDSSRITASLEAIAQAPQKTNRVKKQSSGQKQGTVLAKGTMADSPSGPTGTALTESPKQDEPEQSTPSVERQSSKSPSPSRTKRPTNTLHKQPSVVMEVPEPDDGKKLSTKTSSTLPAAQQKGTNGAGQQHLVARPRQASKTPSVSSAGSPTQRPRQASLEVPDHSLRSARFADTVDNGPGVRHEPLARSVSPAKSAMKNSPSPAPSLRAVSPTLSATGSRASGSVGDQSEVTSITSKKKKARVSFDEDALVSTPARDAPTSKSPTTSSKSDDGMDDLMQPRPALPSFGSVRSPARRSEPAPISRPTENGVSPPRSALKATPGASADHAIAPIILAHDRGRDVDRQQSAPSIGASAGVRGQVVANGDSKEEAVANPVRRIGESSVDQDPSVGTDKLAGDSSHRHTLLAVPDIQVLPATPNTEEATQELPKTETRSAPISSKQRTMNVPGGWDDTDMSDIDVGTGKASNKLPASSTKKAVAIEPADDSDSDVSEAFSDAAEDPSELEPFGYASLDAIVESPVPAPRVRQSNKTQNATSVPANTLPPAGKDDWSQASAYWSKQKRELQRRDSGDYSDEDVTPGAAGDQAKSQLETRDEVMPETALKEKIAPQAAQKDQVKPQAARKDEVKPQTARKANDGKKVMAKSMRSARTDASPQPAKPVAASTTTPGQSGFRKTMRQPASPPSESISPTVVAARTRTGSSDTGPKVAMQRKTMRPASTSNVASTPKPASILRQEDSDSESSFKRRRRMSDSSNSRYTMKKSMRSGSVEGLRNARPASSQGFYTASLRPQSPSQASQTDRPAMRQSLRGIPEGPTLRGDRSMAKAKTKTPQAQGGRFSMSSFTRSGATSPPPAPRPSTATGFRSRFADSDSDEDIETQPAARRFGGGFRSRFAESDDEDETQSLRPSRMPPTRQTAKPVASVRRQSSDLDDSSEAEDTRRRAASRKSDRASYTPGIPSQADVEKAMQQARQNVAAMTGNSELLTTPAGAQGKVQKRANVQPPPLVTPATPAPSAIKQEKPSTPRRSSLLGSIFGRKHSSTSIAPRSDTASTHSPVSPSEGTAGPASPASVRTGKLQRRNTPKMARSMSATSGVTTASMTSDAVPSTKPLSADTYLGLMGTSTTSTPQMPALAEEAATEGEERTAPSAAATATAATSVNEQRSDGASSTAASPNPPNWPLAPPSPPTTSTVGGDSPSIAAVWAANNRRPMTSDGVVTDSPRTKLQSGSGGGRPGTLRSASGMTWRSHKTGLGVVSPSGGSGGGGGAAEETEAEGETEGNNPAAAAVAAADGAVFSERTGKKKRFGRLRKAFGLLD